MILNAEAAQKLINSVELMEGYLASGKRDGQVLSDEGRKEVEADLSEAKKVKDSSEAVKAYLSSLGKLLPTQRSDFYGLFEAMDGYPVIIRLIDPPLHEFLPSQEDLLVEVTQNADQGETKGLAEKEILLNAVEKMHESNPMMVCAVSGWVLFIPTSCGCRFGRSSRLPATPPRRV